MRCSEVCELLSSYMDGMLPAEQMQAVAEHLSLCPDCREELRLLEETVALLRTLGEVEPPADLKDSILKKVNASAKEGEQVVSIRDRLKKWGSLGGLVAVAACLLFVAVIIGPSFPGFKMGANLALPEEAAEGAEGESGFFAAEMPQDGAQSLEMEIFSGGQGGATAAPRLMADSAPQLERKVIKRAYLSLVVEDLEGDFDRVVAIVEEAGGFVQSSSTWENERQRTSNLSVRVPVDRFTEILSRLEELGRVEGREISGQDVTTEYVDTEARLRNLERQEERFLEILDRANTVEEILNIERELERVRGEIEALTARLKSLDELTSLSTIDIELRQLKVSAERIAPPGWSGVLAEAYQAAVSTVNSILNFIGELIIFLGRILPILPLVLLAWLGFRWYKKGRKGGDE
ncbi:MAG TPA: DUF4349 domain-containing protein [Firmicutes bacterium]|nr:DUF4349 domain-containing protein [Bacillota bacterium]